MKENPHKKNRLLLWLGVIAVGTVGVVALASFSGSEATTTAAAIQTTQQEVNTSAPQSHSTQATVAPTTTLSNNNYYTNVDGNSVHSPAASSNGCVAAGATAECNDGTCSFSEHHSGTCSHHGGVSEWL